MLPETLGHIFDVPLRLAPASVAVIQGDTTLTYQELDAWCNRAANALAGLGLPPAEAEAALDRLLEGLGGPPRTIDAGLIRHGEQHGELSTWFGCVLSAGFDATVNERANLMTRPRGRSRYIFALLRELAVLHARPYRIVPRGEPIVTEAMPVSVANHPAPGAGRSRPGFLRRFPKGFRGEHTGLPEVWFRSLSTVRIEAEGAVAYADGERIGPLPVEVAIVPGAVRVLA